MQGLRRAELGVTRVIVSDALDMAGASAIVGIPEAAVRALSGGCDLLCIGTKNTDEQMAAIEAAVVQAVRDGRLPESRVQESANRVRALAQHRSTMVDAGSNPSDAAEWVGVPQLLGDAGLAGDIIASFALRAGVTLPNLGDGSGCHLVAFEAQPNIAVGRSRWGLHSVLDRLGDADPLPGMAVHVRTPAEPAVPAGIGDGDTVLVVGQGIHRFVEARTLVESLRARSGRTLVIDMGWPSPDREFADIATFGGSRLVSECLLTALCAPVTE